MYLKLIIINHALLSFDVLLHENCLIILSTVMSCNAVNIEKNKDYDGYY
jgi:hypothetical protein